MLAANAAGNANYNAAAEVTTTFSVNKAEQSIENFAPIDYKTFGASPFALTAPSATSGLAVVLSVKSGPATISAGTLTLTGPGTVVLAANQSGNADYNAAPETTTSFDVTLDSDGDGVTDYRERLDGTDPSDRKSFKPLSKGLVAFYPFDGKASDESGNGNDLFIPSEGISFASGRFGEENGAVQLVPQQVLKSKDVSSISGNGAHTYSFWIKPTRLPVWQNKEAGVVVQLGTGTATGGWSAVLFDDVGGGRIVAEGNYATLEAREIPISSLTDWHSIVYTYAGSVSEAVIYIDGKPVESAPHWANRTDALNLPNEPIRIGGYSAEGSLSDVRIYNRALSADEVALLYRTESPDSTAPVLTLNAPAPGARFTAAPATFSGSITESGAPPTLEYRLGNGEWTAGTVSGTASPYSWSQNVTLQAGSNTFQIRATDAAGNVSDTVSRSVTYAVSTTLSIATPKDTDGTVSTGFGGDSAREIGASYSVTATPASGMLFQKWLKNGVEFSTSATLAFTMEADMTLTPVFVPNFSVLAGSYNGLVGTGSIGSGSAADMQAFPANNGFIQFTTTRDGALSGILRIEGKSHAFTGKFLPDKTASLTIPRPGKASASATLNLVSALPGEISGTLNTGSTPLAFRALRGAYSASGPHALGNRTYTLLLPAPAGAAMGHGYAKLCIGSDGSALLSGELPSASPFIALARVVDDGNGNWIFPAFVGTGGLLTGELTIPKLPKQGEAELKGALEWLRTAKPDAQLYPGGFLKRITPAGARLGITGTSPLLGGTAATAGFTLTLDPLRTVLPAAVLQKGTWPLSNKPALAAPAQGSMTLHFNPLSGGFEGTFNRVSNGETQKTPFRGAMFAQPLSPGGSRPAVRGAGFLKTNTATAPVEITTP